MYDVAKSRRLARLLRIRQPNRVDEYEISQLVRQLGVYGEQLQKLKKAEDARNGNFSLKK